MTFLSAPDQRLRKMSQGHERSLEVKNPVKIANREIYFKGRMRSQNVKNQGKK